MQVYEVRPRKNYRGVDLISDALHFYVLPTSLTQYRANGYNHFFAVSKSLEYAMCKTPSR